MSYDQIFQDAITKIKQQKRYRSFIPLERQKEHFPRARAEFNGQKKDITIWCSNDYLGQGHNTTVIDAMCQAVETYGTGSGGTRNISGTNTLHNQLENLIASWYQKDQALLFTSGYVANLSTLETLGKLLPDCLFISDNENHNSMIVGMKYSGADKRIFKHNDLDELESILASYPLERNKIIAFESVYSMSGDKGLIAQICQLAKKYNALTYLDEVHAVGMYGPSGSGLAEETNTLEQVDIIQGTFGKAIGCMGGYITANTFIIDAIRSFAPGFIFTTSLPPAITAGAMASITTLMGAEGRKLRDKQRTQITYLKSQLKRANISYLHTNTHITPVIIGNAEKCKKASDILLQDYNIYVQPINYPTVPVGSERFRLTATPFHSDAMIDSLVAALIKVIDRLSIQ